MNDLTPGGLIKVAESYNRDQYLTQNAERIYKVVSIPKELTKVSGYWKTTIEVQVGDIVISQYLQTLNSKVLYDDEGNEYRLLLYYGLIAAIRNSILMPLNGYIIFTPIYKKPDTFLDIPSSIKEIDYFKGLVEYIGGPNDEYYSSNSNGAIVDDWSRSDGGIIINKNTVIKFAVPFKTFAPELENKIHRKLDKEYYYCHRYRVGISY